MTGHHCTIFLRSFITSTLRSFQHCPSQRPFSFQLQRQSISKSRMKYFVIGVSGITCGGKTTLSQLLQRSFPWCRVVHQDDYFYDDDDERHVRLAHVENHVNYEIPTAMDMKKMEEDLLNILAETPHDGSHSVAKVPNFEASAKELLASVSEIPEFETSKYRHIPVLLLEGFLLFDSPVVYDACHARFFLTLTKEECFDRRSKRTTYTPPDVAGYFEECIWPMYVQHYNSCIVNRPGIQVFHGDEAIQSIWKQSLQLITTEMEKFQQNSEQHQI